MKIKVNGLQKEILPISKLKFNAFNTILVNNEVSDLKSYLSVFLDIPLMDIMDADIKTVSLPALNAYVFDIDVEKHVKSVPNTFVFRNEIYKTSDMEFDTFGDTYMFDMFHGQYIQKKINHSELSVYALAVWLNHQLKDGEKKYDTSEITSIYKELCKMPWRKVLPVSFFLSKKLMKSKRLSFVWSMNYTLMLRRIRLSNQSRTKRFNRFLKNWLVIR